MWWWIGMAGAQTVLVDGACPGPAVLGLTGLEAGGRWALLSAEGPGDGALPGGSCAGTPTRLDAATLTLRRLGDSGGGVVDVAVSLGPASCGRWVQAVDLATCATSEPVVLARPVVTDGRLIVGDTSRVTRHAGIDGTGDLDVRCAAWDGEVCVDVQVGGPRSACDAYAGIGLFHPVVAANRPDERACPLICAATTGGSDETATVCEAGDGAVDGDRRACSWADDAAVCDAEDWYWRTDVSTMGAPWTVNVRLGDCYPGAAPLRLSCAGWER